MIKLQHSTNRRQVAELHRRVFRKALRQIVGELL
jgi:hypothetical protein